MSQSSANLVEVRGIRFSRGDRVIFDDISLSVPRGKITAIMGPSGIGKTTLLRLIGGQIPPDKGEILFDGVYRPQAHEHAVSVRRAVHRSECVR